MGIWIDFAVEKKGIEPMRRLLALALLTAVVANSGGVARAAIELYGSDSFGQLYKIDPTTGSSVSVGGVNSALGLGLAYNTNTGTMYALDSGFGGSLSTVDLTTGGTTFVATSNVPSLTGLTFSTDLSTLYSLSGNGGPLAIIDPVTAAGVTVGSGVTGALDLAMDSLGNLFSGGFGGIRSVNPVTGASTPIGSAAISWTAIAFDDTNTLYGIEIDTDALYKIDTTTGDATLVGGAIGFDVRGLAFVIDGTPGVVPEPGQLIIWSILATCGGAAGVFVRRRG